MIPTISFANIAINSPLLFDDSYHIPQFVQTYLAYDVPTVWNSLNQDSPWTNPQDNALRFRGNELPRQKAFWTSPLYRKYSYPGFQYKSMLSYGNFADTPIIESITNALQNELLVGGKGVTINHVIGTRYRGADDNIGFHSDKIQDITENSHIISLSFGETREMHIRKSGAKAVQVIVLRPGDLFILGWKTNLAYEHSIVPVSSEKQIQREPGVDVGPRISLVMRDIATFLTREELEEKLQKSTRKKRKVITE
jgi:alkylated DNA repair dioxygenase AlkB